MNYSKQKEILKTKYNNIIEYIQCNILKFPQDAQKINNITKKFRKENLILNKQVNLHYVKKENLIKLKKEQNSNKNRKLAKRIIKRKIFPKILKYSKLDEIHVDIHPQDLKIFTLINRNYSESFYFMNLLISEIKKILEENSYVVMRPSIYDTPSGTLLPIKIIWKY